MWANKSIISVFLFLFFAVVNLRTLWREPHLFDWIILHCYLILSKRGKKKKNNLFSSCFVSLSSSPVSQKGRMLSIAFWSCCVTPPSCSGTAFVSWSGTIAAWRGRSWQVNTTHDSLLCRWIDTSVKRGTDLATRQFATDTQAYGTRLSRRTVGTWWSLMCYVKVTKGFC